MRLTIGHPRWPEFIGRLMIVLGDPTDNRCEGGRSQRYAAQALTEMGGLDVQDSLRYFTAHGGHCDCEIIMNVWLPWLEGDEGSLWKAGMARLISGDAERGGRS